MPFRSTDGGYEYCLITSRRTCRWTFPKGGIQPGETAEQAALKEAWEEAGLRGEIVSGVLSTFRLRKKKQTLSVTALLMRVDTVADHWKESCERQRLWATAEEARQLLERPRLLQLLELAAEHLPARAEPSN
ncbi:MAG: NUDIX hydrolase [Planctomycetales bacterium]|nr:NUDIX hydrolase [Planctomycetales bacterium]